MRPELASSGATPLWRASWASLLKRSIGPISASSFAAVTAAQPGSSSSAGAVSLARCSSSWSSSAIARLSERQRRDELACEPHLQLLLPPGEPAADALEVRGAAEHPQRHDEGRVELEQVPAQPLLRPPALVDEVVAMVDQQLHLAVALLVGAGPTQVRLPQRRPRDRERVDRVRLAARPSRPPLRDGQLRRHPHQVLADAEQLPLEPTGELAAVLDRPQPLPAERRCPAEQLVASDLDRLLASGLPASSTATAVTDCLCTSSPITII